MYTHEFIRWARRAKNEAKQLKGTRQVVRDLEARLSRLENDDYEPYREIRHRISAHRQRFAADAADNIVATSTAWTDISDAAVRVLAEDAREIWNLLAAVYALPRLERFPPVAEELRAAIAEEVADTADGLRVGAGSFDHTRPDAMPLHQGGELGERARQIVDAIRNVQLLSRLWPIVDGHDPYWRVIVSATISETAALVDLVYEQPANTRPENRHPPLLELLAGDSHADGLPRVRAGFDALDLDAEAYVRRMRGAIGAHNDDHLSISDLMRELEAVDAEALNAVLDNVFTTLNEASRADVYLSLIRMANRSVSGINRLDQPEGARTYA